MKNKKILKYLIIILIATAIFISICYSIVENKTKTTIIQLSPQSDVQMMGYIIVTPNNKVIAIDGGTVDDTENFEKYIKQYGNKIDYWFLTHAHNDHAGVFTNVVENENIQIENIYVSLNEKEWYDQNEQSRAEFSKKLIDIVESEKIKSKVKIPELNEKLTIDNINVEILGIRNPEITENAGNEQSMVIKFDTGKTKLLILGDTGEKSSEKLLATQKDKLKSDIVQMAHHGQQGATKDLYKEIKPKKCLWPTPGWLWINDSGSGENSGPWKTFETREWIKELNVTQNYIAKDRDIIIRIK